jgi:hypothetical protein
MNEAGGKHYGNGCTPWDLQRSMESWGSLFIDARRTDVIEYLFRKKGDKQKQLDDARKALHNCQVIIEELEKEELQEVLPFDSKPFCPIPGGHTLENAKYINYDAGTCNVCGQLWPMDQMPNVMTKTPNQTFVVHSSHDWNGQEHCLKCNGTREQLALICPSLNDEPKTHVGDNLVMFHPTHTVRTNGFCQYCGKTGDDLKDICLSNS